MKKIIFVFIAFFPVLAWAGPVIHFDSEKHDFGNVRQGGQLEHTFEFINAGTDDLIIDKVNAS